MTKLKCEDIAKIASRERDIQSKYKKMLMVCTGTGCVSTGGFKIKDKLDKTLKDKGLRKTISPLLQGVTGFVP